MDTNKIELLNLGECSSLSGSSNLTYHVGYDDKGKVYLRIHASTGKGLYSKQWNSLELVESALCKESKPFTSVALESLFKGKSVNTAGFLLAILVNEGVVARSEENRISYRVNDFTEFRANIEGLVQAQVGHPYNKE